MIWKASKIILKMKAIELLRAHEAKGKTDFLEMARDIKENWVWLRYSYAIAVKASSRMRELGLTQQQLAEKMNCTQQHVSNLLKGQVNMTLETLAKLEQALDFDLVGESLLSFDGGKFFAPSAHGSRQAYLNEPGPGDEELSTKGIVDGYGTKSRSRHK